MITTALSEDATKYNNFSVIMWSELFIYIKIHIVYKLSLGSKKSDLGGT